MKHADIVTKEHLKINENKSLVLPFSHEYKTFFSVGYNYFYYYLLVRN